MPPKRRTLLGRKQTRTRIDDQRVRQDASRAAESPEQRQTRLGDQRARQASSRGAESSEQRQTRLGSLRARQAASGDAESPEQTRIRIDELSSPTSGTSASFLIITSAVRCGTNRALPMDDHDEQRVHRSSLMMVYRGKRRLLFDLSIIPCSTINLDDILFVRYNRPFVGHFGVE
ncbi:unnamed protein product [Didymodactylos carnosus]|uniref:STPR domain-containing protein n=1 Tax=Didymodactylos carnosus TaxID=1234261 RepID=A0A8S2ES26_9BILA|nr:unnamed protein product [Didymodactylos carnosus]CAF4031845.1 unnamed protein product [Didymodactylos carnosus]